MRLLHSLRFWQVIRRAQAIFGMHWFCSRVDVAHMDSVYFTDIIKSKKFTFVIVIYVTCLLVHLSATTYDDKIAIISYGNETANNVTF